MPATAATANHCKMVSPCRVGAFWGCDVAPAFGSAADPLVGLSDMMDIPFWFFTLRFFTLRFFTLGFFTLRFFNVRLSIGEGVLANLPRTDRIANAVTHPNRCLLTAHSLPNH